MNVRLYRVIQSSGVVIKGDIMLYTHTSKLPMHSTVIQGDMMLT